MRAAAAARRSGTQTADTGGDGDPSDAGSRSGGPGSGRLRGVVSFFFELPVLVIIAVALAVVLKTFLIQAFFIPSRSMVPTLQVGDRVLVNKVTYDLREPRRGEVVVFASAEDEAIEGSDTENGVVSQAVQALTDGLGFSAGELDYIKRIIGLPGERVAIRDGDVLINGEPLPEQDRSEGGYLFRDELRDFGPVTVPEGEYFVMGDNRRDSSDSRGGFGTVEREQLVGRAFLLIWPLDHAATIGSPDYSLGTAAP